MAGLTRTLWCTLLLVGCAGEGPVEGTGGRTGGGGGEPGARAGGFDAGGAALDGAGARGAGAADVSEVPQVTVPIYPGKNITVITEAIALNYQLKIQGIHTAQEFSRKLEEKMSQRGPSQTMIRSDVE